jgi:hypothetical protein
MSRRRNKPLSDAYLDPDVFDEDGLLRDGKTYRCNMLLADSAPRSRYTPARMADHAPPMIAYKRGYLTDTRNGRIISRRPGAAPIQDRTVALDAASRSYFAMKDAMSSEWRTWPRRADSCCGGCASDGIADPVPTRQKPFPKGGYSPDPSSSGGSQWPDPASLGPSQKVGAPCTLNGVAGRIERHGDQFICVPDERDSAEMMAVGAGPYPRGGSYAEGMECLTASGELGLLVREGNELNCRCRSDFDHATVDVNAAEARRDRAYAESVRDMQTAYLRW